MSARLIPLGDVDPDLVAGWRRLSQVALEPNVFAEADFVLAAHRRLGLSGRAAIVVCEHEGELRLVLPVAQVRHFRRIPVPAVAAWHHPYSFLSTPLVAAHGPEDSWAEAVAAMRTAAPWAVLEQVGSGGPVASSLARAQAGRGLRVTSLPLADRFVLRRQPGRDYLSRLSGNRRGKVRRLRRRLEADVHVDVVDDATPGPALERAVDDFLAMEAQGWKGADGGAMACRPGHADFFREVCQQFAARGALQLRALQADGVPIAYQCNLVAGDTLFGFKTTFDESYRRYSPGVVLLLDTILRFDADERLTTYDSCIGPGESAVRDLFVDRVEQADLLLALSGRLGQAVTSLTPGVATAYRYAKSLRRATGPGPGPAAAPAAGGARSATG